ncbi:rhodanese-like domain-containing protein [Paenibacillus abyssi]|uniref:Rhodanese domain-containing protein n=2 Tax=Paenibacillus abyssi TaxID=1340531 RepID=A0A917FTV8_9BACL|nr:hypothetical protein GCM10010916_17590 [Paenibacillus abyssi]
MYPKEFVRLYQSPHFEGHIIDVREEWEFHKVKLLGSVSIPLRHLPERLDSLRPSEMYYIICSQGIRSSFAAEYLLESGYTDLRVIQTGIFGLCEYVEHEFGTVPWIIKE